MPEKIVIPYPTGSANLNDTQTHGFNEVATCMKRSGRQVVPIHMTDAAAVRRLLREIDEPSVMLSIFYSDLRLNAKFNIIDLNIFDIFPCRNFIIIGDHLFSEFMWSRAQFLPRSATLVAMGQGSLDEARLVTPGFAAGVILDPSIQRLDPPTPPAARDIDLLVPLTIKPHGAGTELKPFLERRANTPGLRTLCQAVFDALRHDRETQPIVVLDQCVGSLFNTTLGALKTAQPQTFWAALKVLSDVDSVVRAARRVAVLKALLRERGGASVTFVSKPVAEFADLERVTWLGPQPPWVLQELYARARFALDVHPTYPDQLSNRQLDIMANGALLLTDEPPSIRAAFERDRHYRRVDERLTLNDALEGCDSSGVAADAAVIVRQRYSMQNWVEKLLQVIDAGAPAQPRPARAADDAHGSGP